VTHYDRAERALMAVDKRAMNNCDGIGKLHEIYKNSGNAEAFEEYKRAVRELNIQSALHLLAPGPPTGAPPPAPAAPAVTAAAAAAAATPPHAPPGLLYNLQDLNEELGRVAAELVQISEEHEKLKKQHDELQVAHYALQATVTEMQKSLSKLEAQKKEEVMVAVPVPVPHGSTWASSSAHGDPHGSGSWYGNGAVSDH